ncbi:MAG: efflux RND transporter periplasmic adaptor subunit [bacterium]|nr:efflux RND transporter periplasmic adaptor subunit [bacterium]
MAHARGPLKFPVEVLPVAARESELMVKAVGSVEAFEIVPVTARVAGVVQRIAFKEGDRVRAGEGLIEIEPERYELALKTAEAAYDKAKATLREVELGLARRTDIQGKNPGFVSAEELDNWQTRALAARADSAAAAANVDLAELNYRDSRVPAPVSGVIQSRLARTGQYLQIGTVIATMIRRDPLLLKFSVPAHEAQALVPGLAVLFTVRESSDTLRAEVTAVAESADPETRMLAVTAEVKEDIVGLLRPGIFAEVSVLLGEAKQLPVIPQVSIRPSERGFLAYVIQDSVAHERVLKLGLQTQDGMVEVISGIAAGERLVVRGAEALFEGAAIRVVPVNTQSAKPDSGGAHS